MTRGTAIDGRRAPDGASAAERLALHTQRDEASGCLIWTGNVYEGEHPYGRLVVDGRQELAHRLAWRLANGPIPAGRVVRHRCDNPRCVEPDHLLLGTQADNMQDMVSRRRFNRSGERNNSARMTWPKVRKIRADHQAGATVKQLAAKYRICKSQVRNIINGHHWKETTDAHS